MFNPMIKKNLVLALCAICLVSLSGCQAFMPKKEALPVRSNENSEAEVQPVEAVKPINPETLQMSSAYSAIIKDYQDSLPRVAPAKAATVPEQKALLNSMEKLVAQKTPSAKLFQTFEQSVTKLSPENANRLAELTIKGLNGNLSTENMAMDQLSADQQFMTDFFTEADKLERKFGLLGIHPENIKNATVKETVIKAKAMGYSISSSEGMVYYLTDYTSFAKYSPCYTEDFANLMDDLAFDIIEPTTSDAAMMITADNLAARTLHLESGMTAGGGTKYQRYQAVRYISNVIMLFYGSNNTSAYDYETNRLSEVYVEAYKKLSAESGTQLGKATSEYMRVIEANKGIMDDKLRSESEFIIKGLMGYYGLTEKDDSDYANWMMGK